MTATITTPRTFPKIQSSVNLEEDTLGISVGIPYCQTACVFVPLPPPEDGEAVQAYWAKLTPDIAKALMNLAEHILTWKPE